MNKLELINSVRDSAEISQARAKRVVDRFFKAMADALERGDRIEIRGVGSFQVKQHEAYTGHNPKTGEEIEVRPKKLPYFKCGKELMERVDY